MEELDELIGRHVEESIQIDTSETELLERPLLRNPCRRNISLNVRLKKKKKKTNKQRYRV
jgi:hypothetical protein